MIFRTLPPQQKYIRFNKIFSYQTPLSMLYVHLFFVKSLGCTIADSQSNPEIEKRIPIDLETFSKAILNEKPQPNIYLSFKYNENNQTVANPSDVHADIENDKVVFAIQIYSTGNLDVNIMYALEGEEREGLKSAWHPKFGCKRFFISENLTIF